MQRRSQKVGGYPLAHRARCQRSGLPSCIPVLPSLIHARVAIAVLYESGPDPHSVVHHLIDEAKAAMWGQVAHSHNFTGMAEHREVGELSNGIAEQPIHSQRRRGRGLREIPDRGSVLFRFWRPDGILAQSVIRPWRAANSASTAPLERPCPPDTEMRASSTLPCRKAVFSRRSGCC